MILYLHKKCSTCQAALQFLDAQKVEVERVDITQKAPSVEELQKMLVFQNGNVKKLLNTSGLLYREMNLSQKITKMSEAEILDLLSRHGMLVKRPFLLGENGGLLGFKEAAWISFFKESNQ